MSVNDDACRKTSGLLPVSALCSAHHVVFAKLDHDYSDHGHSGHHGDANYTGHSYGHGGYEYQILEDIATFTLEKKIKDTLFISTPARRKFIKLLQLLFVLSLKKRSRG